MFMSRAHLICRRKRGVIRRLKAGGQRGDGLLLLCLDWTLLRLFPPLRATWALKGSQALVPITGRNAKRVLFGAIDLKTARRVVLVRHRTGQADAQAFLRALRRRYRGPGWLWLLRRPGQRPHRSTDPSVGRAAAHPVRVAAPAGT